MCLFSRYLCSCLKLTGKATVSKKKERSSFRYLTRIFPGFSPLFLCVYNCRHKPFQICKNADHHFCDNKAAVGENRFAHSIEELVVWTIERHYGELPAGPYEFTWPRKGGSPSVVE